MLRTTLIEVRNSNVRDYEEVRQASFGKMNEECRERVRFISSIRFSGEMRQIVRVGKGGSTVAARIAQSNGVNAVAANHNAVCTCFATVVRPLTGSVVRESIRRNPIQRERERERSTNAPEHHSRPQKSDPGFGTNRFHNR